MAENTKIERPDLWTKSAYARSIGKSATHVNNMIAEGRLSVVVCTGVVLVQVEDEKEVAQPPGIEASLDGQLARKAVTETISEAVATQS